MTTESKLKKDSLLEKLIIEDTKKLIHVNMDTSSFHQTPYYFLDFHKKPISKILKLSNGKNENQ